MVEPLFLLNLRPMRKSILVILCITQWYLATNCTSAFAQHTFKYLSSEKTKIYTSVNEALLEKDSVLVLNLRNTELKLLSPEVSKFQKLQFINLMKNELTMLPDELHLCTSLLELNIRQNKISSISPKIGKQNKLKFLEFSKNEMRFLPAEIGALKDLEVLILSENKLEALPESIGKLKKLEVLETGKNQLKTSHQALKRPQASSGLKQMITC